MHITAILAERQERDRFLKEHYASPLPDDERDAFEGLDHFDPDPRWLLPADFEPLASHKVEIPTTAGTDAAYKCVGRVRIVIAGTEYELLVFDDGDGGRFIPFRDGTSGVECYEGGRYVEMEASGTDHFVDFNRATNPWCVYDPEFVCPLPPPVNRIGAAVRAGEKRYVRQAPTAV